jgi:hypothetical protein
MVDYFILTSTSYSVFFSWLITHNHQTSTFGKNFPFAQIKTATLSPMAAVSSRNQQPLARWHATKTLARAGVVRSAFGSVGFMGQRFFQVFDPLFELVNLSL